MNREERIAQLEKRLLELHPEKAFAEMYAILTELVELDPPEMDVETAWAVFLERVRRERHG